VAPRPRVLAFGSTAALVVAGAICAVLVGGLTGEVLALALITLGLGATVLLVFHEVGLSEERELASEEKAATAAHERRRTAASASPLAAAARLRIGRERLLCFARSNTVDEESARLAGSRQAESSPRSLQGWR
jgi:hypothetical protein